MRCPRCRHENESGARFCEECAAPLVRTCARCGHQLSPTAKFCPACAHPAGDGAAAAPGERFAAPGTYTPRHLAEKILTSRGAIEGERKQVTVLFADLKGSMELLADRDPEEARALLDPVLERMMEAVHHYEGTVNQVMGDGIMALFGAPVAHEDHAVRACYAALRLQDAIGRQAAAVGGAAPRVRVGLKSGEVVVRAIGSDLHIVVFEDLHWIDGETQAFLDGLVESLPAARVLLLVNYRPEYRHGWSGKTYYRQLRVDPLAGESVEEVLAALLGGGPALATLKRLLAERTEGNPFFLEESVRTLVETGVLAGERGAYRLTRPLQSLDTPPTAQAVLAARIDRLAPEDKRLLQAAAVIGKDVPFALLLAIADEPEDRLRRGLGALQAAEFLYEARLFPDLEYTFKHALTHEVTFGSVLQERRRALDARIVEAIESRHGDRLAEHVERLAHHAFRGEVWDKAVTYSRQAAARVLERSAAREAVAYAEQALQALAHLPDSRSRLTLAVDLRLDLRNSLMVIGEYAALGERLREAEALATDLDDRRRTALLSGYMTHYCWISGELRRARTYAERLDAIVGEADDHTLRIAASYYVGLACFSLAEFPQSVARYRKMLETIGRERQGERFGLGVVPAAMAYAFLAQALAAQGDFDGAIAHGQEGVGIAQAADHPYSVAWTTICLGIAHNSRGSVADALQLAERSAEICREWGYPGIALCAAAVIAYARGLAGHPAESLGHLAGLADRGFVRGGGRSMNGGTRRTEPMKTTANWPWSSA